MRDLEVRRNVTIQRSAEALKEIARPYNERRHADAYLLANRLQQELKQVAALTGEKQMFEDADMMRQYQETLLKNLPAGWQPERKSPDLGQGAPARMVRGTPTPPVVEVK